MDKVYVTYGNGTEFLEELMNKPEKVPRISEWEFYGKYLNDFDEYARTGKRASDSALKMIYNRQLDTFKRFFSLEESIVYLEAFKKNWDGWMRDFVASNPARAQYWYDWVSRSPSFYDALRRINDPNIPNSTVMEASSGITFDSIGKYGRLSEGDPSLQFDTFFPIMIFPRERAYYAAMNAIKEDKYLSVGCGCLPQFRQYGYPLWRIKNQRIVGIDLEKPSELDVIFSYAHGVSFAETGIHYIQGDALEVLKRGLAGELGKYYGSDLPCFKEFFGGADMLGVYSYIKDDEIAIDFTLQIMRSLRKHGREVLDLQVLDDVKDADGRIIMQGGLKFVSKMFNWSEKLRLMPEPSVEAARKRVRGWCKKVGCNVVQEIVDKRNTTPIGVTFVLERDDSPIVIKTDDTAKTVGKNTTPPVNSASQTDSTPKTTPQTATVTSSDKEVKEAVQEIKNTYHGAENA